MEGSGLQVSEGLKSQSFDFLTWIDMWVYEGNKGPLNVDPK